MFKHGHKHCLQAGRKQTAKHGRKHLHVRTDVLTKNLLTLGSLSYVSNAHETTPENHSKKEELWQR